MGLSLTSASGLRFQGLSLRSGRAQTVTWTSAIGNDRFLVDSFRRSWKSRPVAFWRTVIFLTSAAVRVLLFRKLSTSRFRNGPRMLHAATMTDDRRPVGRLPTRRGRVVDRPYSAVPWVDGLELPLCTFYFSLKPRKPLKTLNSEERILLSESS